MKYLGYGILIVVGIIAFVYVGMSLWNWLIPDLFGGPTLSFWQTLGLLFLAKLIFGFGGPHKHKSHWKSKKHWSKCNYDNMTEDEKAKMKEWMCGFMEGKEKEGEKE